MLKIKDSFTIITIILGFAVLPLAWTGNILFASLAILVGGFTDLLDGWYARLTKTGNKFGAEFDVVADLIIFSMAPGILLFFVLVQTNIWIAFATGLFPLLFGCIRLARFNVKRIEYPGYWIGLTRPGLAVLIVAYVNSHLMGWIATVWFTAGFILVISLLNISLIPYIGHHKRKFGKGTVVLAAILVLGLAIGAVTGYFWDVFLGIAVLYLISPFFIPKKEKAKLDAFIRKWKKEENATL